MFARLRITRLATAVGLLAGAALTGVGTAAPAEAATNACDSVIYGAQSGRLVYRAYDQAGRRGSDASSAGRSIRSLPFTPISFAGLSGGAGDPEYWQNDYFVPSTDGVLRHVTVEHWVGKSDMNVMVNQYVATGFRPSLVAVDGGDTKTVVSTSSSGLVYLRKITGPYGNMSLGSAYRLPATLISPSNLAVRHVGTSLRIYSTSKSTGDLTEIIVPDGHPERAKAYRIASSGFETLNTLVAGFCYGTSASDVQLVGINTSSGNAVMFRHKNSYLHGATLTSKIPVGAAGGWKSWTGIGD